jgi:hypothetical protein
VDESERIVEDERLALRVPVGRDVRVWSGLRAGVARLIDLSVIGCRVCWSERVRVGSGLWLLLPAGLGGRAPLPVRGRVVWSEAVAGMEPGPYEVAVHFQWLPWSQRRLEATVAAQLFSGHERRTAERLPFRSPVVAQQREVARLLMGRDLSEAGLRVDGGSELRTGEKLRLALHAGPGLPALVVKARVARADSAGAALEFLEVNADQRASLSAIVHELAPVTCEAGRRVYISEVLAG